MNRIVARKVVEQWFVYITEVLSEVLLRNPLKVSGNVEIDASLLDYIRKHTKGSIKKETTMGNWICSEVLL